MTHLSAIPKGQKESIGFPDVEIQILQKSSLEKQTSKQKNNTKKAKETKEEKRMSLKNRLNK